MLATMDVQALIDIGFMALVGYVCFQTLLKDKGGADDSWRNELRQLEHVLKDLIGEASAASVQLDRNLAKRKAELEGLLAQMPQQVTPQQVTPQQVAPQQVAPQQVAPQQMIPQSIAAQPLVPQPTMQQPAAPQQRKPLPPSVVNDDDLPNPTWAQPSGLESLIEKSKDTVTLSANAFNKAVEEEDNLMAGFENSAIIDPVTYKIAMRLLKEGKEIHVVARKLELPVSEVRQLDGILRREEVQENQNIEASGEGFENMALNNVNPVSTEEEVFDRQSLVL